MLLADEPNIREVIVFPMTQKAEDLMMGAPNFATPRQLKELNIKLIDQPGAAKAGVTEAVAPGAG
jgi:aspartyl-tRNA synthetase